MQVVEVSGGKGGIELGSMKDTGMGSSWQAVASRYPGSMEDTGMGSSWQAVAGRYPGSM